MKNLRESEDELFEKMFAAKHVDKSIIKEIRRRERSYITILKEMINKVENGEY